MKFLIMFNQKNPRNLNRCIKVLHTVGQMIGSPLSQYKILTLQKNTSDILQIMAFILHNMYTNTGLNKQMYILLTECPVIC